ncbi:NUDIX domain-containing protein [Francisella sp. Scap27]|uniref:NUDIX hydrolase n=1 Tax=Francisella sp. Scap27 TaxID=2589986 RepID=UPI0015BA3E97|nr:NUDIX domain-containing protein [Francisella sp. Scap27]QLE79251.1 NUDIX domain-containing protein [Francisella sp. Scap27]
MIKTAALVCVKDNKILLVRVRDNTIWYFAGGKIDSGESAGEAVLREVKEELGVTLQAPDISYLGETVTDNHDRTDTVSIQCFASEITQEIKPCAEISEIKWFDLDDKEFMSPGVVEVIRRWYS